MNGIPKWWQDAADSNAVVRFIDACLRGAAQVMFQDNPITGLLFLIGIAWGGIAANMPSVPIGTVVGVVSATVMAMLLHTDEKSLRMGLYGFNGALVGTAIPTFMKMDVVLWGYLVIGAAVSTVVMLAISNVFKTWNVPALTAPFVLTTWLLFLAGYAYTKVGITSLPAPALPAAVTASAGTLSVTAMSLLKLLFLGVAQVYLIQNVITGIIFVVAILVNSRWSALFALFGSGVALATVLVLVPSASAVSAGLFGFSAVLTGIAVGSVFYKPSWQATLYALLAVVFTTIVQGALDITLAPIGIPTLTAPFVLATWLFLLPKEKFEPVPHALIKGGAAASSK